MLLWLIAHFTQSLAFGGCHILSISTLFVVCINAEIHHCVWSDALLMVIQRESYMNINSVISSGSAGWEKCSEMELSVFHKCHSLDESTFGSEIAFIHVWDRSVNLKTCKCLPLYIFTMLADAMPFIFSGKGKYEAFVCFISSPETLKWSVSISDRFTNKASLTGKQKRPHTTHF